jgi:tetratricopeptide (TPR) repeat protein
LTGHQRDLTEWDVVFGPPTTTAEVKLQPTRADILDWLRRVQDTGKATPNHQYQLVYGSGAGRLLKRLSTLIDNAMAAADVDHFTRLVGIGFADPDVAEILASLGEDAFLLLQRVEIVPLPAHILEEDNRFRARLLAGETGGRHLVDLLFRKFSMGAATRLTFPLRHLIPEIAETGITLQTPPIREAKDVSAKAAAALVILQACQTGIPLSVVAAAVGAAETVLEQELAPAVMDGIIVKDDLWSVVPLPGQLNPPDTQDVLASALERLLVFIEHQQTSTAGRVQVFNAIALAKRCFDSHPSLVAEVFRRLDKRLKDVGDKHLVLDVAELSIGAAQFAPLPKSPRVLEAEAHALICGRSWVYQRVGRLKEARVAAEKSLQIGQDIGWDRNSAYCKKCIGRLYRLEAEADSINREHLLTTSVKWLTEAIERFQIAAEFGPTHPEVGDCFSLLGRTYLVMRRTSDAEQAIKAAHELIHREGGKDYVGLLILGGDWEASRRNWQAASNRYEDALDIFTVDGAEASEMRARALAGRARVRKELGEKSAAAADFQKAADIYHSLGEVESSAAARWMKMTLLGDIPDDLISLIASERATVRLTTIQLHNERLAAASRPVLARRSDPGRLYWSQLVNEAKRRVAAEDREW